MELLKFSSAKGNAKLATLQAQGHTIYTFSMMSGWTCPGAEKCLGKVVLEQDGYYRRHDGPNMEFRCFSATQEAAFPAVRAQRQYNFDLIRKIRSVTDIKDLIERSLPKEATIVRIHVAGDFLNLNYMKAWFEVARKYPKIRFYAYTKSLNYWVELMSQIPTNMSLTASKGGKFDHLIELHGLKFAEVVFSEKEALDKGLDIDHDDSHAVFGTKSFALLLHGNQKKDTLAAEALKALKGVGSYSKTKKPTDVTTRRKARPSKSPASI